MTTCQEAKKIWIPDLTVGEDLFRGFDMHLQSVPIMVHSNLIMKTKDGPKLNVKFFRQRASWVEPVREWLRSLPEDERKVIGEDIKAVQYGWPLRLPLVDHVDGDIGEVRSKLGNRIARVLFCVEKALMILLHGFINRPRKPRNRIWILQRTG